METIERSVVLSSCRGRGGDTSRALRIFRTVKLLHVVNTCNYTFVKTQSVHREQTSMWSTDCGWWWRVDAGPVIAAGVPLCHRMLAAGQAGIWESSVFPAQFFCVPKTALKNSLLKKCVLPVFKLLRHWKIHPIKLVNFSNHHGQAGGFWIKKLVRQLKQGMLSAS